MDSLMIVAERRRSTGQRLADSFSIVGCNGRLETAVLSRMLRARAIARLSTHGSCTFSGRCAAALRKAPRRGRIMPVAHATRCTRSSIGRAVDS